MAHVHLLARDWGGVSMTLAQHMVTDRGVLMRIKVAYHGEEVAEAVQRLRAQSRLPLDRVPTLDEVLAAYRENILSRQHEDGLADAIPEVEDLVLIPAVRRRPDLVREGLELARTVVAGWRYTPLGKEWLDDLTRRAEAVNELDAIVAGQVAQLKLDKLPDAWQSVPQR